VPQLLAEEIDRAFDCIIEIACIAAA